jgi:hypothetical protein
MELENEALVRPESVQKAQLSHTCKNEVLGLWAGTSDSIPLEAGNFLFAIAFMLAQSPHSLLANGYQGLFRRRKIYGNQKLAIHFHLAQMVFENRVLRALIEPERNKLSEG